MHTSTDFWRSYSCLSYSLDRTGEMLGVTHPWCDSSLLSRTQVFPSPYYRARTHARFNLLWQVLEESWDHFAPSWPNLSHIGAILGAFWGELGAVLGSSGPS